MVHPRRTIPLLVVFLSLLSGCRAPAGPAVTRADSSAPIPFTDVTDAAGIRFVHHNGAAGKKMMPETTGSGCAFLDYDNDGWDDIYVTFLGTNHLYHNNHGTFTDVTETAGVAGASVGYGDTLKWKWSSSCAWVDYNNDGKLDLFVCNFVKWSPEHDVFCGRPGGQKQYCAPRAYDGTPNTLYRNNGNGTFTDVSKEVGLTTAIGKGWGVALLDFNGDGWMDFAVSNDLSANFLFMNHGGKRFTEEAAQAGIALGESGNAKAGMGIDVADWQNNGKECLLIGNFSNEKLSLWTDDGSGFFTDMADKAGLGEVSLNFLTFGLFFFDYDLDGWQDAFIANGHIDDLVHKFETRITYAERPLLFHNEKGQRFTEVGLKSGAPMKGEYVLRGCAVSDINNDGYPDVVVVPNNDQPARLWRNEGGNGNHWIRFKLEGARSNRDGIGAMVTVRAGGIRQRQMVKSGGGFLIQSSS